MLHNFMKILHLLGVDLIDCTVMTGQDKPASKKKINVL